MTSLARSGFKTEEEHQNIRTFQIVAVPIASNARTQLSFFGNVYHDNNILKIHPIWIETFKKWTCNKEPIKNAHYAVIQILLAIKSKIAQNLPLQ